MPAGSVCDELTTNITWICYPPSSGWEEERCLTTDWLMVGTPRYYSMVSQTHIYLTKSFSIIEGNDLKAVRVGEWKPHLNGGLYNLAQDIGESRNIVDKIQMW